MLVAHADENAVMPDNADMRHKEPIHLTIYFSSHHSYGHRVKSQFATDIFLFRYHHFFIF